MDIYGILETRSAYHAHKNQIVFPYSRKK